MGGDWFKTFVCQKKVKVGSSKQVKGSSASAKSKGFKWKKPLGKESSIFAIGSTLGMPVEDVAAIRIQTAFRAYKIDWSGGPETMEEILSRINQREKAAVKRERAMAYAFSHQWRANPNPLGKYELGKADWGWSWKERWIAARPWEIRVPSPSISQKKVQRTQAGKSGKDSNSPTPKSSVSVKPSISNGKGTSKARRLSFPDAEKPSSSEGNTKAKEESSKKEQLAS
ncbi:IQ-domain 9 [Citrus sinensis]|uniref:IQ-domain 9 n=1 Tax=Citrus sinensis TaxID=2711 RepID=A0ACB8NGH9_CITSI|nr:IQ-domain 9 [Citrus sinensis]